MFPRLIYRNSIYSTPMEQTLRITLQLRELTLEDQLARLVLNASPKSSTLNRIRARARAVRPL